MADVITEAAEVPASQRGPDGGAGEGGKTLDSLMDEYFPDEDQPAHAVPETEAETPAEDEGTLEGQPDPEFEDEDTEVEDEGGVEDTGEDTEEEDEDSPLEDEEDPELDALLDSEEDEDGDSEAEDTEEESFLPEFDRVKFLKDHPELEKPYKHFQSAFTKKMMELSSQRKQMESKAEEIQTMEQQYNDFMEQLKGDESFEEFVVQAALHRPEVMEKAYERALSLSEDEGEKKKFLHERELKEREERIKKEESKRSQQAQQARVQEVVGLTERAAKRLGLDGKGDLEVAEQFVANKILQNRQSNGGKPDISNEEVVMAVKRAAKALSVEKAKARKAAEQSLRKKGLESAKKRAKQKKRPAPPSGGKSPGLKGKAPDSNDPRRDPMDAFIDQELGNDDGGFL